MLLLNYSELYRHGARFLADGTALDPAEPHRMELARRYREAARKRREDAFARCAAALESLVGRLRAPRAARRAAR